MTTSYDTYQIFGTFNTNTIFIDTNSTDISNVIQQGYYGILNNIYYYVDSYTFTGDNVRLDIYETDTSGNKVDGEITNLSNFMLKYIIFTNTFSNSNITSIESLISTLPQTIELDEDNNRSIMFNDVSNNTVITDMYDNLTTNEEIAEQRSNFVKSIFIKYVDISGDKYIDINLLNLSSNTILGNLDKVLILNGTTDLSSNGITLDTETEYDITTLNTNNGVYVLLDSSGNEIILTYSLGSVTITKRSDGDFNVKQGSITSIKQIGDLVEYDGIYFILGSVVATSYTSQPNGLIGSICFHKDTPIKTDQGLIKICLLKPGIHTINGKKIKGLSETVSNSNHLILIKKGALGRNKPSRNTKLSNGHKVKINGKMIKAGKLVRLKGVKRITYDKTFLYNIIMDKYSIIKVNNMFVETLHPLNMMKKLFTNNIFLKLADNSKNRLIDKMNNSNKEKKNKRKLIDYLSRLLYKEQKNKYNIQHLFKLHNKNKNKNKK